MSSDKLAVHKFDPDVSSGSIVCLNHLRGEAGRDHFTSVGSCNMQYNEGIDNETFVRNVAGSRCYHRMSYRQQRSD